MAGPKREKADPVPGVRYRVSYAAAQGWTYSERDVTNVRSPYRMLARVLVAKIADVRRLSSVLRATPLRQDDPAFGTRVWVADALARVARDGKAVGRRAELDWARIEATATGFVARKTTEGRFAAPDLDAPQPMWDMLEDREVLP